MSLEVRPIELKDANNFVARLHRHHKPVVGHRFSIACWDTGGEEEELVGVCIVGRPVARHFGPLEVCEVTRLCTNGKKNACSKLYAAAARAAKALGFCRIQTYTLDSEHGSSLKASGWISEGEQQSRQWKYSQPQAELPFAGHLNRRQDQPTCNKIRWAKLLKEA